MENSPKLIRCVIAVALTLAAVAPTRAIESKIFETAVRGYPVMRDASGRRIADGTLVPLREKDRLDVACSSAGCRTG